jgi:MFS family permease
MISLRIPNGLNFVKNFLLAFTFFFLPLLLFDLGFDGLQIGVLMSSATIVTLFSSFPIGIINDRLSVKYVIIAGMLLESVFFAGLYAFKDFWVIIPFFMAGGLGGNMIETSIRSLTFKALSPERRGKRLGILQLARDGGFGLGMVFGGFMLFALSFSGVLLVSAVAFLVMAFVSYFVVEAKSVRFPLREYKSIILKKGTAIFLLPLFIFGMHWGAEHTSYSLFLREELGLGLIGSGIYMGVPVIVLAIVALVAGLKIDRTGSNKMPFFVGLIVSGIGHVLMAFPVIPVSFLFRVVHEIGDSLTMLSYNVSFSRIFKTDRVAGETGIAYTVITTGGILGSLLFGPLGYTYGFAWPFIISGLLTLVSFAILFLCRKRANF